MGAAGVCDVCSVLCSASWVQMGARGVGFDSRKTRWSSLHEDSACLAVAIHHSRYMGQHHHHSAESRANECSTGPLLLAPEVDRRKNVWHFLVVQSLQKLQRAQCDIAAGEKVM